jgi:hypothetical protein
MAEMAEMSEMAEMTPHCRQLAMARWLNVHTRVEPGSFQTTNPFTHSAIARSLQ